MIKPVVYPPKSLRAEVGKRIRHKATGYWFEKSKNGKWALVWKKNLVEAVRTLYVDQGKTLRYISTTLNVSHSIVQRKIDEKGWMRSKRERGAYIRKTLSKHALLKRMYLNDNKSAGEIAKHFGIDESYLEKYFKGQDYCRTASQATRLSIKVGRNKPGSIKHERAWEKYILLDISSFDMLQYTYAVRRFTDSVMLRYGKYIDPAKKRSRSFHVDHRISIAHGYSKICKDTGKPKRRKRLLPLHVICHPANLILMPGADNAHKSARSSLTVKELKRAIKKFDLKHGAVFNG